MSEVTLSHEQRAELVDAIVKLSGQELIGIAYCACRGIQDLGYSGQTEAQRALLQSTTALIAACEAAWEESDRQPWSSR